MCCRLAPLLAAQLGISLLVSANEVVWTASGTVTAVGGPGFTPLAAVDDPLTIELRYNDSAPPEPMAITDIPNLVTHQEYRLDVNIDLKVTVGASTWQGTLTSGVVGRPYTIEVQNFKVGPGTRDFFRVRAAEDDGAAYPMFPGATPGPGTKIEVEFRSATSATFDEPDYLGSVDLKCPAQSASRVADAIGTVLTATDGGVEFAIDPETIETNVVGLGTVDLKSIDFSNDEVTLTWATEAGKFYTIQYLDEFLCWKDLFSTFADGSELSETFFPDGFPQPKTQLYRVVEDE